VDKAVLRDALVARLETEWESLLSSAQDAFNMATDAEHQSRSKYETFSLEASYLARGQAERVAGLRADLDALRGMSIDSCAAEDPVRLGSLIACYLPDGSVAYSYLVPVAGGERLNSALGEVQTVSAATPLGRKLLGKRMGETVSVVQGDNTVSLRLSEIW